MTREARKLEARAEALEAEIERRKTPTQRQVEQALRGTRRRDAEVEAADESHRGTEQARERHGDLERRSASEIQAARVIGRGR